MQTSKIEHLILIKDSLLRTKEKTKSELQKIRDKKHVFQDEIDSFNKDLANIDELVNAIEEEL